VRAATTAAASLTAAEGAMLRRAMQPERRPPTQQLPGRHERNQRALLRWRLQQVECACMCKGVCTVCAHGVCVVHALCTCMACTCMHALRMAFRLHTPTQLSLPWADRVAVLDARRQLQRAKEYSVRSLPLPLPHT